MLRHLLLHLALAAAVPGAPPLASAAVARWREHLARSWRWLGTGTPTDTVLALNAFGYELLAAGRNEDALAVFELNAAEPPASANACDSLGEGCMRAGRRADAIRSYRRSLVLDPPNPNAAARLGDLQASP